MPQSLAAESAAKLNQSAQSFLSALKSGLSQNFDSDVFANLLSQTKSREADLPLPRRTESDERPARAARAERAQRDETPPSDDTAEIRATLQEVREKLAELREQARAAKSNTQPAENAAEDGEEEQSAAVIDAPAIATDTQTTTDTPAAADKSPDDLNAPAAQPDSGDNPTALAELPLAVQISKLQSLEHHLNSALKQLAKADLVAAPEAKASGLTHATIPASANQLDQATKQFGPQHQDAKVEQRKDSTTPQAQPVVDNANASLVASKETGQSAALQTYLTQKQAEGAKQAQLKDNQPAPVTDIKPAASASPTAAVVAAVATAGHSGKDGAGLESGQRQHQGVSATGSTSPIIVEGVKGANSSYDFAGQLSATRLTKGGNVGLPHIVEQVALQINKQAKDGLDQMTIQLRPAELGRVEIRLEFGADQRVQGRVIVDNPATLDLLQKDARGIERALQDAGLRADAGSMEFSLRDGNQSGAAWQQERQAQRQSSSSQFFVLDQAANVNEPVVLPESYFVAPGRVNLKV
jgi:flagellar hook-length control protein FliK